MANCNCDQLQLGPTATAANCNCDQLQLDQLRLQPAATAANCNCDQLQLGPTATATNCNCSCNRANCNLQLQWQPGAIATSTAVDPFWCSHLKTHMEIAPNGCALALERLRIALRPPPCRGKLIKWPSLGAYRAPRPPRDARAGRYRPYRHYRNYYHPPLEASFFCCEILKCK